jgi:hypothetical protein
MEIETMKTDSKIFGGRRFFVAGDPAGGWRAVNREAGHGRRFTGRWAWLLALGQGLRMAALGQAARRDYVANRCGHGYSSTGRNDGAWEL